MSVYNLRNPAVKRLMKEAEELSHATDEYHAQPLEDNLFEWHFSIRGPPNSDFEGGIYHGRITLPPDYPMKPPSIILLTPNGRFETNKKICLSISGYHPESWQPSWSIRTALLAIIGFMPTHGNGALGSLDYTPAERKELAVKSQEFTCPDCGSIKEIFLKKKSSELANGTAATKLPCNIMEFSTPDGESHKKSEKDITTPDGESHKKSEKDIITSDEESNKKFEKDIPTPEEESHKKSEKDITTSDRESHKKLKKDITTTSDEDDHKNSEKDITTLDEKSHKNSDKDFITSDEECHKKSEKDITTSDEESNKKFEKDIPTPEEESREKSEKDITTSDRESHKKLKNDITISDEDDHKNSEKDITTLDEKSHKNSDKDIITSHEECHKKSDKDITLDSPVYLNNERDEDNKQSEEALVIGSKRKPDFYDSTTSDRESLKKLKKDFTTSDEDDHKNSEKDIATLDEKSHKNSDKDIITSHEECHKKLDKDITLDSPVYLNNERDEDNKQSEEALVIGSKRKPDFYDSKSVKMKLTDETTDLVRDVDVHRKQKDECYIYGKYVAAHLRNYNALTQSVVKHLIGNILFRADIGQLNLNVSSANNSHCFFSTLPTSTVQMQHNNPTPTQIYTPPVSQYSHVASSSSHMGNTIPNMFSNPAISGLFRQNSGIPGLLAQSPRIRGLFGQNLRIPGPIPKFSK